MLPSLSTSHAKAALVIWMEDTTEDKLFNNLGSTNICEEKLLQNNPVSVLNVESSESLEVGHYRKN